MLKQITLSLIALSLLLLAGCAPATPDPQEVSNLVGSAVAQTVESIVAQTQTAQPSPTPVPSSTTEPSPTPEPSPELTLEPSNTPTLAATSTSTPDPEVVIVDGCDVAAFIADITVPDGTEFNPGTGFTKTWELANAGTCSWGANYLLVFFSGDDLQGPVTQTLSAAPVAPGQSIRISVNLVAPETPGRYISYWLLRNADGDNFGIGVDGDTFYLDITVIDPNATLTPTPTATATPTQ